MCIRDSALAKPNRGVRPLCCGDPLRRLVGKCFCIGASTDISENNNFGVGCPGGVEVVAHSLRNVLEGRVFHDEALLKIDFRNAFNLIDRSAFTRADVRSSQVLLYDHERVIDSTFSKATPWAPLYFCCGIACLVEKIQQFNPRYNKWYMDDGGVISSADNLDSARRGKPEVGSPTQSRQV